MSAPATAHRSGGRAGPLRSSGSLRTTWLVARRELRIRVKTRVFVITTAVMLIAVVLAVALPAILSGKSKPVRIGVAGSITPATTASSSRRPRCRPGRPGWPP